MLQLKSMTSKLVYTTNKAGTPKPDPKIKQRLESYSKRQLTLQEICDKIERATERRIQQQKFLKAKPICKLEELEEPTVESITQKV